MTNAPSRCVHFSIEDNVIFEYENDYNDDNKQDCFYPLQHNQLTKAAMRASACHLRREGYGMLLQECFDTNSPMSQDMLNAFARVEEDNCARGMERYMCRQFLRRRSDIKENALSAVFLQQRKLARRRQLDSCAISEQIAIMYSNLCEGATLFARRIAIADEVAVLEGDDSSVATRMVEDVTKLMLKPKRRHSSSSWLSDSSTSSSFSVSGQGPSKIQRRPQSPVSPVEELDARVSAINIAALLAAE